MSKSTVMAGMTVIAGLVVCVSVATAQVSVSVNVTPPSGGSDYWLYNYEIDNTGGSDWIYYLELDPVDMATVTGYPTNWDDVYCDTSVGGFASWSGSAESNAHWIALNATLDGFMIESIYGPGSDYVTWGVYGDDDGSLGGSTTFTDGQVTGPAVPEPSSICAMILALGMVTFAVRRRKQAEWQPLA